MNKYLFVAFSFLSSFCLFSEEPSSEKKEVAIAETDAFSENPLLTQHIPKDLPAPPVNLTSTKNSFLAVSSSLLFPGLGHLYLGDYQVAGNLIGTSSLGVTSLILASKNKSYSKYFRYASVLGFMENWPYGIYAAYRDVRSYNQQVGYNYAMPSDSYSDLRLASFEWSILKKPEVWGGYLGALTLAGVVSYFFQKEVTKELSKESDLFCKIDSTKVLYPISAFNVSLSEETLFRGFLQPMLSEYLTPSGGLIASSFLFGAAHLMNTISMPPIYRKAYYTYSIPFITSFGFYFGWLANKNTSLKESIALHSWYDFTLFALGSLTPSSSLLRKPEISFSYSFSF